MAQEASGQKKKTPPRYVRGVKIKVGIIDISSKFLAKTALISPAKEKLKDIKSTTKIVIAG